jgi:hypothetical protein
MRRIAFLCLLATVVTAPIPARAQDTQREEPAEAETEGARALFNQGLSYVAAADWSNAIASFRAALDLRQAPAIEYNLAAALFETGALDEAAELNRAVRENPETPESLRASAEALDARIASASGELVITVEGADRTGVEVLIDGTRVPDERIGARLTVARGPHAIEARRDGNPVAAVDVEVTGESPAAGHLLLPAVEQPSAVLPVTPEAAPTDASGPGVGLWLGIGLGAAALVAIVVVIAVVATSGTSDPFQGSFEPGVLTWP